jgi:hypothetical protein
MAKQIISSIQALSGWGIHNGNDGVGGVPAKTATFDNTSQAPLAILTVIGFAGAKNYEDVDFYKTVPFNCAGVTKVCQSFDRLFATGSNATLQAIETDLEIVGPDGYKYNTSLQIVQATGALQVSDVKGNWVSTGNIVPAETENLWHHVQIFNNYDFVGHTSGTAAFAIDDDLYLIPTNLQKVPATLSTWGKNAATVQLQLDENTTDGVIVAKYNNVTLTSN